MTKNPRLPKYLKWNKMLEFILLASSSLSNKESTLIHHWRRHNRNLERRAENL